MLLDPRTIRKIAAEIGLRPTKQRGQNFVHDPNTVRRIVAAAKVKPGDVVLEVGPGLGSLTLGLLEAGARVLAVEIEPVLAQRLRQTVAELAPETLDQLIVLAADALRVTELPLAPVSLVANLPYNVSVPVILHLLATFDSIRTGLVMVQSEVADRLVAPPGSKVYGVPSAKLAWYAKAERIGSVPPNVFWPVPKVDSGLVAFQRLAEESSPSHRKLTFQVIDAAFSQRRKMLRSALAGLFESSAATEATLLKVGIDPKSRGEVLSISDFSKVALALSARATAN